jgi:hypothetical protein
MGARGAQPRAPPSGPFSPLHPFARIVPRPMLRPTAFFRGNDTRATAGARPSGLLPGPDVSTSPQLAHCGPSRVRPPPSRTPPADVPVLIRTQVHRPRAVRVHAQASTPGAAPAFGRKLGSAAGSGFARGSQGTSFSVLSNTLTLSRLNPRQRRRAGLARSEPFFPKKPVLTTPQHPNHTYSGTSGFVSHRRVVKVRPDSRSITSANPNLKRPRTKTKRK